MNFSVEDLDAHGYHVIAELNHEEIVPFVRKCMGVFNLVTFSFIFFNALLIAGFLCLLLLSATPAGTILSHASTGLLLFFVILLPLHELIHGTVYKMTGAPDVTYHADLRKMVFYAMANHFVANRSAFYKIGLAPFVIISSLLLAACAFLPEPWTWACWGALIFHTGGCYGDFGLVSFFYNHRDKEIVTYDDAGQKKSFFLAKG